MNDALDLYNNSDADIVIALGTIPFEGFLSVAAVDSVACSKDPLVRIGVVNSSIGVSVYGTDLGTSAGSAADTWLGRVATGQIVY